tara:strand:- start:56 stop:1219 length:1164 start_codon:yes stop_codon:yes gene_type:complete
MSEETKTEVVEENPSTAEKETIALKKIGADVGVESITKVDLRESPAGDTTEETPKEEVTEVEETTKESIDKEPIIEEVKEESKDKDASEEESKVEQEIPEPIKEQVEPEINIPEGIAELVNFINETGGSIEDYIKLNKNYSELNDDVLLREFYNTTKSHLSSDEINFIIEDNFSYDEEMDDPTDIKRKKLAYKEELAKAKNYLEGQKEKYYKEVKTTGNLSAEQQKAIDFFNRYNIEQESFAQSKTDAEKNFKLKTNEVFNQEFKGFDFNIDDKKFKFKVNNAEKVKDTQSDIMNIIGSYLDKNNYLNDGYGYHKALFAAQNADKIANHFYQLGKTEAIKEVSSESKNINMDPRQTSTGYVEAGGIKVRAISGDDSSKLRIKLRDKK